MSATLELLRSLPIFGSVTPDELGKIAELYETTSWESGKRSTDGPLKWFLAPSKF
jgi:hypothetical protein